MRQSQKTCLILITLLTSLLIPHQTHAQEEIIEKIETSINVQQDSSLIVTEKILYNFGTLQRHGIVREIQNIFTNQDGEKYKTPITIQSLTDEFDQSYKFTESESNASVDLKIGDPVKTVSGQHTYIIKYIVKASVESFSDHDEIFWNATGNNWSVPIKKATVEIHMPNTVPKESFKTTCFTGKYGSTEKNCTQELSSDNRVFYTTTKELAAQEGLSTVLSFEKGHITIVPKTKVASKDDATNPLTAVLLIIGTLLWYVLVPLLVIIIWLIYGRDPKPSTTSIPTFFDPPTDTANKRVLTPAETGTIIDESADNHDITATIVDLAIRGHLKIVENEKKGVFEKTLGKQSYTLTKTESSQVKDTLTLQSHEKILLDGLFEDANSVNTNNLKNSFHETSQQIKDKIYEEAVTNGFFPHNPKKIRNYWTIGGSIALFTINLPLGIMALVMARVMPKKTLKGVDASIHAKGLKKFLTSQERQLEFQEENWYLFEKLLPYAIAFKVTETWAKRFSHLNAAQNVSWYEGNQGFTPIIFANSLGAFDSAVGSVSTPTTSSGGFSSGFGGGGFSGGGFGGGGGGGSW